MLKSLPTGGHKKFLIYLLNESWESLQPRCKKYVYIDAFIATKFNYIYSDLSEERDAAVGPRMLH